MKLVFALASFLLAPVLAQDSPMPACASECLVQSLQQVPVCNATDISCICSNQDLNAAIKACVGASCTVKQALTATNATMTMCGAPVRDRTHLLPLISGISGLFALVAVIVRTIAAGPNFGLDDFFACAAMAGAIPMDVLQLYTGPAGFGKDVWNVSFDNIYLILKYVYITQVLYYPVSGFTKLAFLFFYLRVFPHELFRKVVFGLIGTTLCYVVAFDFAMAFSTWPTSYTWTAWDGEHTGRSIDVHGLIYAGGAVNIALDVAILVAPIPELIRLTMSLKKKLAIVSIFSVGIFTLIVSCIRLQKLVQFAKTANPTWDNLPSGYWSMLEVNVGIFCVCMPAFRRTLARILPRMFGSTKASSDQTPPYKEFGDSPDNSDGSKPRKRAARSWGRSLLNSGIEKTVDTKVETSRVDGESPDEDEIHLVEMARMTGTENLESRSNSRTGWRKNEAHTLDRPS
ncbi:hypothetical protein EJ04DRAFT_569846 [Polyplosphaeria fusca]|uniref:CFEM domain-containing protein n=1 Tax=Polyplosphaeria fusca TaxID=682080 RepID=A0A9P4QIS1_9PLEO|nr:hypothetical protein EJ04DRAFT_569846 [Polyplosphaeria fusca]